MLLQDLTRKGPFSCISTRPCKILQDPVGSCGILQESCRNLAHRNFESCILVAVDPGHLILETFLLHCSGVGMGCQATSGSPMFTEGGPGPLQTLEGYNLTVIMPLSTNLKAVIKIHKNPLHEYYL